MSFEELMKKVTEKYSLEKLENRMLPSGKHSRWGDSSEQGFIWHGEKFNDVMKKDYDFLESVSKDYFEMASLASDVLGIKGVKHRIKFPTIGDFKIVKPVAFGFQSCPFGCEWEKDEFGYDSVGGSDVYIYEKDVNFAEGASLDCNIERLMARDAFLIVPALAPHLIATHGLFQGRTAYRTDPTKLLEFWERVGDKRKDRANYVKSFFE
ncbi:hypothetical protein HOD29_04550 [archaeon]|jgi:hypothetical protein|nr:hypothetical protein [archaeon]